MSCLDVLLDRHIKQSIFSYNDLPCSRLEKKLGLDVFVVLLNFAGLSGPGVASLYAFLMHQMILTILCILLACRINSKLVLECFLHASW